MDKLSERIRRQVVATRGYLVESNITPHFADILMSHYLDFAREIEALDAARSEGLPPPGGGGGGKGVERPEPAMEGRGDPCPALSAVAVDTGSVCRWLASSWFYGNFRPETYAERQQERHMRAAGWWPVESESDLVTRASAWDAGHFDPSTGDA